jgi:hypothetical protein
MRPTIKEIASWFSQVSSIVFLLPTLTSSDTLLSVFVFPYTVHFLYRSLGEHVAISGRHTEGQGVSGSFPPTTRHPEMVEKV